VEPATQMEEDDNSDFVVQLPSSDAMDDDVDFVIEINV